MVTIMYKHLLIATDGSDLAQKAIGQGLALAKALGAKITAVHVTLPWTAVAVGEVAIALPPENYEKIAAEGAVRILGEVTEAAKKEGVDCDTVHVEGRSPAEGIIHTAKDVGADLIVMSSHGRSGLARLLLGSEAGEVVSRSQMPVLICR
jgi:nucleotide-binding universal stress UspA family protein